MSNALAQQRANEIVRLHGEIEGYYKASLERAIRIGELLVEQKEALPHGQWGPWVAEHLPFTERTASRYMRLHTERDRLESDSVSDLTIAYKVLAPAKPTDNVRGGGNVIVNTPPVAEDSPAIPSLDDYGGSQSARDGGKECDGDDENTKEFAEAWVDVAIDMLRKIPDNNPHKNQSLLQAVGRIDQEWYSPKTWCKPRAQEKHVFYELQSTFCELEEIVGSRDTSRFKQSEFIDTLNKIHRLIEAIGGMFPRFVDTPDTSNQARR